MNAVTEGIDAIATTRVVISGDNSDASTHALTGQTSNRTFRSVLSLFTAGIDSESIQGYLELMNFFSLSYYLSVEVVRQWISLFPAFVPT